MLRLFFFLDMALNIITFHDNLASDRCNCSIIHVCCLYDFVSEFDSTWISDIYYFGEI